MSKHLCLLFTGLIGCSVSEPVDESTSETDVLPSDPQHIFSFAAIADPHITTDNDHADRLRDAVSWIDAEAAARSIEVVVILGDVGWSGGAPLARSILDELPVPYVPINGDNEIQNGEEIDYHMAFESHYEGLSQQLDNWRKAPVPVFDEIAQRDAWFQNLAFTHHGVRFVGLDWSYRLSDPLFGEMGHLHDFDGGTLPWLEEELAAADGLGESVVLFTHEPMVLMPGGFTAVDFDVLAQTIQPYEDLVYANLAGHLHIGGEIELLEAGIDVQLVDATWDDVVTVHVVDVYSDGRAFTYEHENIEIN